MHHSRKKIDMIFCLSLDYNFSKIIFKFFFFSFFAQFVDICATKPIKKTLKKAYKWAVKATNQPIGKTWMIERLFFGRNFLFQMQLLFLKYTQSFLENILRWKLKLWQDFFKKQDISAMIIVPDF